MKEGFRHFWSRCDLEEIVARQPQPDASLTHDWTGGSWTLVVSPPSDTCPTWARGLLSVLWILRYHPPVTTAHSGPEDEAQGTGCCLSKDPLVGGQPLGKR